MLRQDGLAGQAVRQALMPGLGSREQVKQLVLDEVDSVEGLLAPRPTKCSAISADAKCQTGVAAVQPPPVVMVKVVDGESQESLLGFGGEGREGGAGKDEAGLETAVEALVDAVDGAGRLPTRAFPAHDLRLADRDLDGVALRLVHRQRWQPRQQ